MVLTGEWQSLSIRQEADNSLQFLKVLAAFLETFDVPFELRFPPDGMHDSNA
jgi:hypothetical protein